MNTSTLMYITNEHNNWLDTLAAKKQGLEMRYPLTDEHNAPITVSDTPKSMALGLIAEIDTLQKEINDNLLDIAWKAEESSGVISPDMQLQHEQMQARFEALNAKIADTDPAQDVRVA